MKLFGWFSKVDLDKNQIILEFIDGNIKGPGGKYTARATYEKIKREVDKHSPQFSPYYVYPNNNPDNIRGNFKVKLHKDMIMTGVNNAHQKRLSPEIEAMMPGFVIVSVKARRYQFKDKKSGETLCGVSLYAEDIEKVEFA